MKIMKVDDDDDLSAKNVVVVERKKVLKRYDAENEKTPSSSEEKSFISLWGLRHLFGLES